MPDDGIALCFAENGDADAPGARNASDIVPDDIHDHDVLGSLLLRRSKSVAHRMVGRCVQSTSHGALHGSRADDLAASLEKELGRRRQDLRVADLEIGGIASALREPHPLVERKWWAVQRGGEGNREVHLVDVARLDQRVNRGDPVRVLAIGHLAGEHRRIDGAPIGSRE